MVKIRFGLPFGLDMWPWLAFGKIDGLTSKMLKKAHLNEWNPSTINQTNLKNTNMASS